MPSTIPAPPRTEDCCETQLQVRKASMRDVPALLALINAYASEGIMLPRTEFEMAENLRDFTVLYCGTELAGCGALHFYTPATAEIRSLAVSPKWKKHGIGKALMDALDAEARGFELDSLFAFTYIPNFFQKHGFLKIDRGELPLKAWKDCLRCPKFQCCDEIAVVRQLRESHMGVGTALPLGNTPTRTFSPKSLQELTNPR
jgi:amino-acid N-acetyltransferase